jgi:uncharacterized protein YjbI with pentapeptide repeats
MANDAQMSVLKRGATAWNAWRAERPKATIDLADAGLRGFDLSGADLAHADLRDADLRGANLAGAALARARLGGANLFKALLDGADLKDADLRGVQFLDCARLAAARNWQSAYRDEDLACGAAIPKTG